MRTLLPDKVVAHSNMVFLQGPDPMTLLRNLTPIVLLIFLTACVSQPPEEAGVIQETSLPQVSTLDPLFVPETPVSLVPTLNPDTVAKGEQLYLMYCAVCHGTDLEGQPNWKQVKADGSFPAPPQDSTGHTWHHPDDLLLDIIANGGDPAFGGTMPGFGDQLTEEEALSILDFIKSSWGDEEREFQWRFTSSQ